MDAGSFYYAHLLSKSDPTRSILETIKLPRGGRTVQDVKDQVLAYLRSERDDGNKIYTVQSVHPFDVESEAREDVPEIAEDIFVVVSVEVDTSRHVKPLEMREAFDKSKVLFKTLTKYTYFESGKNYIKVQLSELAGLTKEVCEVEFQNRSLSVKVFDFNGQNFQFAVLKL